VSAPVMRPHEALLTALAGATAYDEAMFSEVLAMATDPAAFAGAIALAAKLAQEVDRLGGDSKAVRRRVYDQAQAMAAR
jgi:hypothetical protein